MHARVFRVKQPAGGPGRAPEQITQRAVPLLRQQRGFVAAYWLADSQAGEGITVVLWDDAQAADAAELALRPMRAELQSKLGVTPVDVRGYEVIAHS